MVAYTVQAEHRALILQGAKDFTLRKVGDKRHARLGETFALDRGVAGEGAFATAACTLRARVVIGPKALLRVLEPRTANPSAAPLLALLQAAEQGAYQAQAHLDPLARRDGFATWADLYAFNLSLQKRGGPLLRELIGWDPASLARVSARAA